jgi:hypothetical protein
VAADDEVFAAFVERTLGAEHVAAALAARRDPNSIASQGARMLSRRSERERNELMQSTTQTANSEQSPSRVGIQLFESFDRVVARLRAITTTLTSLGPASPFAVMGDPVALVDFPVIGNPTAKLRCAHYPAEQRLRCELISDSQPPPDSLIVVGLEAGPVTVFPAQPGAVDIPWDSPLLPLQATLLTL